MSKRKASLHKVMEQLDTEVEEGSVSEGAHLRLCKLLKTAFDEAPTKEKHIKAYIQKQLLWDPFGAMCVPLKYRHLFGCSEFLKKLFDAKRKEPGAISEGWCSDLLDGMIPEWFFNGYVDDVEFFLGVRAMTVVLLEIGDDVRIPLEKHLNKHNMTPTKLFKMRPPTEEYEDFRLYVTDALSANARFLPWILMDDGYTDEEKNQFRECAFDYSDPSMYTDANWLNAVGLKDMMHVMSCVTHRALGKSFEEARALALANDADEESVEA